jgi:hypothetical protein
VGTLGPEAALAATSERGVSAKAAYTSFNGDYLRLVPRMCLGACLLGYAPLNPEAALGYYVSTVGFGNEKANVMRACLAVEFRADEFWLITARPGIEGLREVPEGVLAEYLLWRERRPEAPARQFPWLSDHEWLSFLDRSEPSEAELERALLGESEHRTLASLADPRFVQNVRERLFDAVEARGLPRVAFVSTASEDDKHLDWARRSLYDADTVAFVPDLLVPQPVIDALQADSIDLELRMSFASRADEMWIFTQRSTSDLPPRILHDLELARLARIPVHFRRWSDVGVPKYTDPNWALSDRERETSENDGILPVEADRPMLPQPGRRVRKLLRR